MKQRDAIENARAIIELVEKIRCDEIMDWRIQDTLIIEAQSPDARAVENALFAAGCIYRSSTDCRQRDDGGRPFIVHRYNKYIADYEVNIDLYDFFDNANANSSIHPMSK